MMSNLSPKLLARKPRLVDLIMGAVALIALTFIFAGCSSNSGSSNTSTCSAGSVQSSYGCLPQGNCPSGYGSYNGQCVVANSAYGYGTTGYGMTGYGTSSYGYGSTCTAGYVATSYGCLPQSACQAGFGDYSGYCINASGQYYYLGY